MKTNPIRARSRRSSSLRTDERVAGGATARGRRTAKALQVLQEFRLIFGSARRFDSDVRRATGVPGSLLWALSEIAGSEGLSVNALADRMALHQTTASNIVNALVERGLVRRSRHDGDQRVVHLQVTPQGTRVLRRAPGPHAGLLVDALRQLEDNQLELLHRSLLGLTTAMRDGATSSAAGETLLGE
jgi:DNA-binding MarR family transcriptional regulator